MNVIPHKTKQFLLVLVKILIVSAAFYYIYIQLKSTNKVVVLSVLTQLSLVAVLFLVLLSMLNWLFEVLKWKQLVSSFKQISFYEALNQTLSSLTASVFTPNRIGEYGAKALFFKSEYTKRIFMLNFVHNSSQMLVTMLFGLVGLLLSPLSFKISPLNGIICFLTFLAFVGVLWLFKNFEFYGFSIQKLRIKLKQLPIKILFTTLLFSAIRYVVFSFQFLYLLYLFNVDITFLTAISTVFLYYFMASVLPSIHLFDIVVKSSVALFLFTQLGIDSVKIISITGLMWLFNLVLPVVFGSFFVFRFTLKNA